MPNRSRSLTALTALSLALVLGACSSDDDTDAVAPNQDRVFVQVERLGNPLVSEVMLAKRNHAFHNAGNPSTDMTNHSAEVRGFITGVAGRDATVANTLISVLLPDMLIVQTNKPGASAGWLTWALADGYGGRKLTDDVVDAGLKALFGDLLSKNNVTVALTTDNINANDSQFSASFPYLASPH
jgi:hypothetical protein